MAVNRLNSLIDVRLQVRCKHPFRIFPSRGHFQFMIRSTTWNASAVTACHCELMGTYVCHSLVLYLSRVWGDTNSNISYPEHLMMVLRARVYLNDGHSSKHHHRSLSIKQQHLYPTMPLHRPNFRPKCTSMSTTSFPQWLSQITRSLSSFPPSRRRLFPLYPVVPVSGTYGVNEAARRHWLWNGCV